MNTEVNEQAVELAYKLILGRPPESVDAIRSHLRFDSLQELSQHMMDSPEFKAKLLQSQYASGSKWVSVDVLDRYTQWVDLHDRYVSHGCINNDWEPSESQYFIEHLGAGDTVLDIGANIGWFSLLAAKTIGPAGKVHAFEPRPETAKMLKRTLADNGLREQVSLWEYALSDSWGSLELAWSTNTDNPGGSFLASDTSRLEKGFETANVKVAVLDDLLPDVAPDLIKIDVEGAEPMVMAGSVNALRRKRPSILSELYPEQLSEVSNATPAQYIDQLASLGYGCFLLEDGKPTKKLKDFPSSVSTELVSVVFERTGS
ncbi:MAG: FkbM family methyltransferase [bacterium]